MRKVIMRLGVVFFLIFCIPAFASAHCEVPCGIYDDEMRIKMLREHIDTMEKSMMMIKDIQKREDINYNQLTRWINNKEKHANKFQHIVTQYYMTQRIKLDTDHYEKKLVLLHRMVVYAMKSKQTTDMDHIEELRECVDKFEKLYFKEKK